MKDSDIENININKEDIEVIKEINKKIRFLKIGAIYLNMLIIFIALDIFVFCNIFFQITAFLVIMCCMYLMYILIVKIEP